LGATPKLGNNWSESRATTTLLKQAHELHRQNFEAPKVGPRQELEGKLLPLSPFLFGFVTAKKVTTTKYGCIFNET